MTATGWLAQEGTGPPLVLLHGAGGNHRVWEPLCEALDGLRILAPSYPGRHGVAGPQPTSVAELADWVLAWLAERGVVEPCVFCGWSLGGAVALEISQTRPHAVAGLALLSTGARLRVHPAILEMVRRSAERGEPAPMPRIAWHRSTPRHTLEVFEALQAGVDAGVALQDWSAANAFDRVGRVEPLTAPALVFVGADDQLTPPKYAQWLVDRLSGAEHVVLAEAGHLAVMERPAEVAESLVALVERARDRGAAA